VGIRAACVAVGVAQAGYYRRNRVSPAPVRPVPVAYRDRTQPRALSPTERQGILDVLHSERFVDLAPAEVGDPARRGRLPGLAVHVLPAAARRQRNR